MRSRHRSIREQIAYPRTVDTDSITASYQNGVLEVYLPLSDDVDRRGNRIEID
jgi:HSP20 family protein